MIVQPYLQEAGAQQKFTEVRKAYDTLSDPAKRQQYDRFGREATERMERNEGGPGVSNTKLPLTTLNLYLVHGYEIVSPNVKVL